MERVNVGVGKKRTKDVAERRRMSTGHGPTWDEARRGEGRGMELPPPVVEAEQRERERESGWCR